jgi:hypothetical protein
MNTSSKRSSCSPKLPTLHCFFVPTEATKNAKRESKNTGHNLRECRKAYRGDKATRQMGEGKSVFIPSLTQVQ